MTEKALNEILLAYNGSIQTKYKNNWGSLITFLGKSQSTLIIMNIDGGDKKAIKTFAQVKVGGAMSREQENSKTT